MSPSAPPKTRYVKSGEVHIAYQVVGNGPIDVVYVPTSFSHVEHLWEAPPVERFFNRITSFARVLLFDRRGSGLSDPVAGVPTLEEQMDDVLAVMGAAGSERAALFGQAEGGTMAALFAATHPDRTGALILFSAWARMTWAPDYPWANTEEERGRIVESVLERWGDGSLATMTGAIDSDDEDPELVEWFGKLERLAASPGTARLILAQVGRTDIRDVLPTIRVPTLLMSRPASRMLDRRHAQYLADQMPGARHVELPGTESLAVLGDADEVLDQIEVFLTGARHEREPDRVLATIMFTDIVDSTGRAAELGDAAWRRLLARHDELVRRQIARHRGREVKATGDGFLATFDGPARAITCARTIADLMPALGIEVRTGLHTGECELIGDDIGGLAVHIAARVSHCAGPSEVLVSSTVRDLVAGSGIRFEDRGFQALKGVPDEWRLFAVVGLPE